MDNAITVKVKKISPTATMPTKGSEQAAGYDLYADLKGEKSIVIPADGTAFIGTGLTMAIPVGYWGGIYARSKISCKRAMRPANCVGVIDSDYRGEVIVCLRNDDSKTERTIQHGERIAQIIVDKLYKTEYEEIPEGEELPSTDRGEGGFGSTGRF